METIIITRDEEICLKCGECVDVCPNSGEKRLVIDPVIIHETDQTPYIANQENCIGCFSCKDACRSEAISIEGIPEIKSILIEDKLYDVLKRII